MALLARMDRLTDQGFAEETWQGRLHRAMQQVPDPLTAALDDARHLTAELLVRDQVIAVRDRAIAGLEVRLVTAQDDARWHAWVSRGYRNYLVLWFAVAAVEAVALIVAWRMVVGG